MRYGTTHSLATDSKATASARQERPKRFLEGGRVATWRMAWHETAADLSLGKEGSGRRVKAWMRWAWDGHGVNLANVWRWRFDLFPSESGGARLLFRWPRRGGHFAPSILIQRWINPLNIQAQVLEDRRLLVADSAL